MITVKVNNEQEFSLDFVQRKAILNGQSILSDWITISPNKYHVIMHHRSYTIEIVSIDEMGKQIVLMVNGQKFTSLIQDQYDILLKQLGMDKLISAKVNEVKAPMPGMVLRVMVEEGQSIQKGDALFVLEAMKMENIIKAVGDGVVKNIKVQPKLVVEKNQVMMIID